VTTTNRRSALGPGHLASVTCGLLKLVREFETDPAEVRRLQAYGDPTPEQLRRAKEYTQRMRERGELRLRSSRRGVPPAIEQAVRERFAQGWSRSRLAHGFDLDRRTVKRILRKSSHSEQGQNRCRGG
jgi:DNA invertase Pin-like site-specific DNA recombinase